MTVGGGIDFVVNLNSDTEKEAEHESHTHVTTSNANTVAFSPVKPKTIQFPFCQRNKLDLAENLLLLFDTTSIPSNLTTAQGSLFDNMITGGSSFLNLGGQDTHFHLTNNVALSDSILQNNLVDDIGICPAISRTVHSHTLTIQTNQVSHLPPFREFYPGSVSSVSVDFDNHLKIIASEIPPIGYTNVFSDGRMIRLGANPLSTGGSVSHFHDVDTVNSIWTTSGMLLTTTRVLYTSGANYTGVGFNHLSHRTAGSSNAANNQFNTFGVLLVERSDISLISAISGATNCLNESYDISSLCTSCINKFTMESGCTICKEGYYGSNCENPICNGFLSNDANVCNGNGQCVAPQICSCKESHIGGESIFCAYPLCFGVYSNDSIVCSHKHGNCTSKDICECFDGWGSPDCSKPACNGTLAEKTSEVCSGGNGVCELNNVCRCFQGRKGRFCEIIDGVILSQETGFLEILLFVGLSVSIAFIVIFVIFVVILFGIVLFFIRRQKKFSKLKNVDLLIKEQELEDNAVAMKSTPKFETNKQLCQVPLKEIELKKELDKGGGNARAFIADWKGIKCVFKVFKMNGFQDEQDFREFERESLLASSLHHPNIVRFIGVSLDPTRIGILLEFCEKGDLEGVILREKESFVREKKIRVLIDIARGIMYLHSKNVIHRDIKPKNVFLRSDDSVVIGDFGVSRFLGQGDVNKTKTMRIGTHGFMAPEVFTSSKYDEKCDVYSFGCVAYCVLELKINPFPLDSLGFEKSPIPNKKPKFSPQIAKEEKGMVDLINKCLETEPNRRPSFEEFFPYLSQLIE